MAKSVIPSYRLHKSSGQAIVSLRGRIFYLGKYKSPESRDKYQELISEYTANSCIVPPIRNQNKISIEVLVFKFMEWAEGYYVQDGKQTLTVQHCRYALDPMIKFYGENKVSDFGPMSLKFLRDKWTEAGLTRKLINSRVNIVRQAFSWGVENELVTPDILQALKAVANLKAGRSKARETEDIPPVADELVEKTLPFCPPIIADMVQIQRLAGLRPQDVTNLRGCDIERNGDVWKYSPYTHKTKYLGKRRDLAIGPRAQAILTPYLVEKADNPEAFLFSPADTVRLLRAKQRENRKSKVQPSQASRRKTAPKRTAGNQYTHYSYRTAIHRACDKAKVERWNPNQLRHGAGDEVRDKFGLDHAQAVMGHASAKTTEIYAKVSFEKAAEVMREIG